MNNLETAYNQAMEMLQKGRSKQEVLLEFGELKNELAPLLDISLSLLALPKIEAPRPAMQRKYALAPSKGFWLATRGRRPFSWLTWIHISKFAGVSMSLMLLISALSVTGYAALKSEPGKPLFPVKKLAEQSQFLLAFSQDQQANIQLQITQSRLSDAQQIFSDPNSNPGQKTAALSELANQTSNAVAVVNKVAQNDPKSDQASPLVNSLEAIAAEQKNLLTDIKPDSQVQAAADTALKTLSENSTKISAIKNLVAVADSDQSLTQLAGDPNSVGILGKITQLTATQITVEKTSFVFTTQTVIKDQGGKIISQNDLATTTKVSITGTKDGDKLLAQQILVVSDNAVQAEVKGDSTVLANGTSTTSTTTEISSATSSAAALNKTQGKATQDQDSSSTEASSQPDPNTAVGSYILEDPSPQFTK